jgi:hypothetical protein
MSGVPALYTVHTRPASTSHSGTDLDPGIRPPMATTFRVLVWFLGISLYLVLLIAPFALFAYWMLTYVDD